MKEKNITEVEDVHPMMLVNYDNYHERMEEYAEQLSQFMANHPDHAVKFQDLYGSLCDLQDAMSDETLERFDILLVQQEYGYHFYTLIDHTDDGELIQLELLYGLAGVEHTTFGLLYPCTGIMRVFMDRETALLPLLKELLMQLYDAIQECKPEETQRLQHRLSPAVATFIKSTLAINYARADGMSTSEVREALNEWHNAADAYDTVFLEEFHEHYVPFGCIKGHHLIHEIDKGITCLVAQLKDRLQDDLNV